MSEQKLITLNKLNKFYSNLKSKLNIVYDDVTKQVSIRMGQTVVSSFDATAFIKDGMISSVQVVRQKPTGEIGPFLRFIFNTDSGKEAIYVDLSDITSGLIDKIDDLDDTINNDDYGLLVRVNVVEQKLSSIASESDIDDIFLND